MEYVYLSHGPMLLVSEATRHNMVMASLLLQEAQRKEALRKQQSEEAAAQRLLEHQQAAAATALADRQRQQRQEEAAAAEAARVQEELTAKVGLWEVMYTSGLLSLSLGNVKHPSRRLMAGVV